MRKLNEKELALGNRIRKAVIDHDFSKVEEMLNELGDEQFSLDIALYKALVEYKENKSEAKFEEIKDLFDKGASFERVLVDYKELYEGRFFTFLCKIENAVMDHEFSKAEEMLNELGDEQCSLDVALYKAIVEYKENKNEAKFGEIKDLLDKGANISQTIASYSLSWVFASSPEILDVMLEMMRRGIALGYGYEYPKNCFVYYYNQLGFSSNVSPQLIEDSYGKLTPEYMRIAVLANCYAVLRNIKQTDCKDLFGELVWLGYEDLYFSEFKYNFEKNGWDIENDGRTDLVKEHEKICIEELKKVKAHLNPKSEDYRRNIKIINDFVDKFLTSASKEIESAKGASSSIFKIFKRKHSGDDAHSHHKEFPQEERIR